MLGAGVVGTACAAELVGKGYQVDIVDRGEPGGEASGGNAGMICASQVNPLIDLAFVKSLPLLFMRKDSPLLVTTAHLKTMGEWLKAAGKSSAPAAVERNTLALTDLNRHAYRELERLCREAGMGDKVRQSGILYAYTTPQGWEAGSRLWNDKQELGISWSLVPNNELAVMEPVFSASYHRAVIAAQDGHVSDPREIVQGLAVHAAARGARLLQGEVVEIAAVGDQVHLHLPDQILEYDGCVLALGAWSAPLARQLGDKVLLESMRGLSYTYPQPGFAPRYPAMVVDRGLTLSTAAGGLRIGGMFDLSGLDSEPHKDAFPRLERFVRELAPRLDTSGAVSWTNHRPATPDSLPVIGPCSRSSRVLYAFGHGHLGLTQSGITARCIGALASGEQPPCPLAPFGAERFA